MVAVTNTPAQVAKPAKQETEQQGKAATKKTTKKG